MSKIRVLFDACVLLPIELADLLLRLADAEMYEALWSEEILGEVERNLTGKFNVPVEKAVRRLSRMRSAFPHAVVENYEGLMSAMTNDPKDHHVAAAAVRGGAALIVTANLRDFPPESLSQYEIEAIHPDDFLLDQLELAPDVTMTTVIRQRESYTRPPYSVTDFYLNLRRTVPRFASAAGAKEIAAQDPNEPMPLQIVSPDEAMQAFFPDGPPAATEPLGAAYMWWSALLDREQYLVALHNLTWHPPAWGDYEWAFERLSKASIMQFVDRCPGDEDITYVKFMPGDDHSMVSFGSATLPLAYILTMVRCSDGMWRAWALRENNFPSSEEVRAPS